MKINSDNFVHCILYVISVLFLASCADYNIDYVSGDMSSKAYFLRKTEQYRKMPVNDIGVMMAEACYAGNVPLVVDILKQGYDVNTRIGDASRTALHYAIRGNSQKIIKMLLKEGADKSVLDQWCLSPFSYAKEFGYSELEDLLSPFPMKFPPTLYVDDMQNRFEGSYEVNKSIIHGNKRCNIPKQFLPYMSWGSQILSGKELQEREYVDACRYMLDVNAKDMFGNDVLFDSLGGCRLVLHLAVVARDVEMIELLIRKGCDIDAIESREHSIGKVRGRCALHIAVECNQPGMVTMLLKYGANPFIKAAGDTNKPTPRQLAESLGYAKCAELLYAAENKFYTSKRSGGE